MAIFIVVRKIQYLQKEEEMARDILLDVVAFSVVVDAVAAFSGFLGSRLDFRLGRHPARGR